METSRLPPKRIASPRAVTSHIHSVDTLYMLFRSVVSESSLVCSRADGGCVLRISGRSVDHCELRKGIHVQARISVGILRELRWRRHSGGIRGPSEEEEVRNPSQFRVSTPVDQTQEASATVFQTRGRNPGGRSSTTPGPCEKLPAR